MDETTVKSENPLPENITPLLNDLYYPSESDEPVFFVSFPWMGQERITACEFAKLLGLSASESVEEKEPERFWSPVTTNQDWYETEERERTDRFVGIRHILEQSLENIQYFEVGKGEVELYLVGQSAGNISGIKTTAVRT